MDEGVQPKGWNCAQKIMGFGCKICDDSTLAVQPNITWSCKACKFTICKKCLMYAQQVDMLCSWEKPAHQKVNPKSSSAVSFEFKCLPIIDDVTRSLIYIIGLNGYKLIRQKGLIEDY